MIEHVICLDEIIDVIIAVKLSSNVQSWIHVDYDILSGAWTTLTMGSSAGSLFIKRTDVLPQDLVKSRSHEIRV